MPQVTDTRHLWIGGLVLLAVLASPQVRGALWMNLGSLHYHRALRSNGAAQQEQVRRARDLAGRAGAADPMSSRPLVLAAAIEAAGGDARGAIAFLELAVALEPANVGARFQLAEAYHKIGADDRALPHWREAGAAPMLLQQGDAARASGDLSAALDYFEQATVVDPGAYEPWIALGNALWTLSRFEDARRVFGQLIDRYPGRPQAYERVAALLIGPLSRPSEAEAVVEEGIARAETPNPDLYMHRSRLAFRRSDYASAEQNAQRAIELSPRIGDYLAWLGQIYYHQQRYPEALAQYQRTETDAAQPTWRWRSYRRIGQTYGAMQNWPAAVEAYRTALTISLAQGVTAQVRSQNHLALGEALRQNGDVELARAEFTQALADDPANERAARFLAAMRRP